MTLKYFCDRCHGVSDDDNIDINITGENVCSPRGSDGITCNYSLDLCRSCFNLFQEFLNTYNNIADKINEAVK